MRFARTFVLAFLSLPFAFPSPPQQNAVTVQRDPQAIAVLQQSLNTMGGMTAVTAIQDFTGTGTITYHWAGQDVQGSVSVYGKGLKEFRMDATVSRGSQSLIIDSNAGTLTLLNGEGLVLPYYSIMTAGSMTFPAARIAAALNDSSTSLIYLGLVAWKNSQAYKVHVVPPVDPSLIVDPRLQGLGEFDLYVDSATSLTLEIAEKIWWGGDLSQTYSHEIVFSNYLVTGGLSVPFNIAEKFGGQDTWSVSLSSMTFNSGLSDSLFTL